MSKAKPILEQVPLLYKSQYLDISMFAFVQGIINIRPLFKITKALEIFAIQYNLDETYSIENELNNYYRMLNKFLIAIKSTENNHLLLLHKTQYLDTAMFAFVKGILSIRPDYLIDVAISIFANIHHLKDGYSIKDEVENYKRMSLKFESDLNIK